jgi:hypothetical protein
MNTTTETRDVTMGVCSGMLYIYWFQQTKRSNRMSDAHRRYGAIQTALMQLFGQPTGHKARHVQTLAALICGIVGSTHTHIPRIASHVPTDQIKDASFVTRVSRWYQRDTITDTTYFLPVIQPLLAALAVGQPRIELLLDGSAVGHQCVALVASIVYRGRAIPIAWTVVRGKKGHLPEATHLALLAQVRERIPACAEQVVVMGDGEFDGTALQAAVEQAGWTYVCRTATNTLVWRDGTRYHTSDMPVQPDRPVAWPDVRITGKQYGPVQVIAYWDAQEKKPLYLVTNLRDAARAVRHYLKRAHIETFFSDQKSRGFRLDKSHLADPARLARLLIAACLAYIWIIYLGRVAHQQGWVSLIHRTTRCDLSLFQVGLRFLQALMKRGLPIPVGFVLLDGDVP